MKKAAFIMALFVISINLYAEEYGAHVHGAAHMEIIQDQTEMEINISLPGMDFMGSEHSDHEKSHQRIENIKDSGKELINLTAKKSAAVSLEKMEIILEDDDHLEEHHSEYIISIEYNFKSSSKLKYLDLQLFFKLFPTVESIQWMRIYPDGQDAGECSASDSKIKLKS